MKRYVLMSFFLLVFIVISFVLSPLTVSNTKDTLDIIFQNIIPSLFPLMLLTLLFIELGGVEILAYIFQKPVSFILGISGSGFCVLLSGLIGGSPLGAIVLNELMDKKLISDKEGQKLFNVAAFISPGFTLVSLGTLNNAPKVALSYYLALLITLILSGFIYENENSYLNIKTLKVRLKERYRNFSIATSLVKVIKNAGLSLLIISGTMVLFNLPFVFLKLFLSTDISILISGLFEFSKSTIMLMSDPGFVNYLYVVIILSWGGLAMMFQNLSYKHINIKIKPYVLTRVFQMIISSFLLYLVSSF